MKRQPPNRDASLSDLLYFERPLLRPIKFVQATHTPFLFQESEEIFQSPSTGNSMTVQSDVPTAERVACIFNNTQPFSPAAETIPEGETSDVLEEIDFADLGSFRAQVDAMEHAAQRKTKPDLGNTVIEETFTGVYKKEQLRDAQEKRGAKETEQRTKIGEEKSALVAAGDTTLRTLEQSIETLQVREHRAGALHSKPSESAAIKPTLPKPNNALADVELEDSLSTGNIAGKSGDILEQTAAAADTEHIDGDHGSGTPSNDPEEIDFADLGAFRAQVDSVQHSVERKTEPPDPGNAVVEETFTGNREEGPGKGKSTAVAANGTTLRTLEQSIETLQVRENPRHWSSSLPNNSNSHMELEANQSTNNTAADSHYVFEQRAATGTEFDGGDHGFFIDTQPTQPFAGGSASDAVLADSRRDEILGEEEEKIVYVAPYPRSGRIQPTHDTTPRVTLPTCSLLTGTSETWSASKEQKDTSVIVGDTVSSNSQSLSLHSMSLDFQRMESSAQPRHPAAFTPSQKKKEKLRLKSKASRVARRRHARMQFRTDQKWETRRKDDSDIDWGDDIDNMEKSGMRTGVGALVADDGDDLSNSEGGMDLDPDVGSDMNAMLRFVDDQKQMIEEDQAKASAHTAEDSSDEDEDESEEDEEEEAVLQLEEQFMIAESEGEGLELHSDDEDALTDEEPRFKNNRRAMHSGDGVDISSSKRRMKAKDKADYLPEELQAQWERDRAKKAENKRLRKEARMLASLDPLAPKKGGKKARKLMMAALKQMDHLCIELDDMSSIEATMRRFAANIDGRRSMPLLPMKKNMRKIVHELATAFNLKSSSKGHGEGRYVTLVKTNRTGTINEGKVKAIVKRATRGSMEVSQKKGRVYASSHREGEEVGKEAPAIGKSNVGFKMLSSMGWSEGVKIGGDTSVGIEVPLTVVIKKSRLGLGATRT
ncbi:hypothetical protein F5J12DRAFT_894542 [Pisolithus orientalis]|uniref:uncharacterized protein n=1 Tax=Pisolithus orientalis TaxID=936130 RepID=UPI00222497CE|nr:uncharacterized protein F5J12DRAFT_894542 [Pisolithus orientalis]KAI6001677.1 hypothetical protein F5J12DRAFT_894542 [Pisolithus orientalis]